MVRARWLPAVVVACAGIAFIGAPPVQAKGASADPRTAPVELAGPPVLHAPEPDVPQLQNRDPRFRAPFDRVSGTERYVDGEYLYTDHLYDDHGADTARNGGGPRAASAGDLTYPTNPARYGANAADLVELRIAAPEAGLAVRITLDTLLAGDSTIAVLAFDADHDRSTGADHLPRDPGAPFPGTDHVLSTWGTGAEWSTWEAGRWVSKPLTSRADLEANQITVSLPASVARPSGTWSAILAVGLYDPATGGWLHPATKAGRASPGGAGRAGTAPAIFNLGFRFDEPVLHRSTPPDEAQAAALAANEPVRFAHDIDFDLLARRGERDNLPTHGTIIRYFPSRLDLGEGRAAPGDGALQLLDPPVQLGRLQPYSVYVPSNYQDGSPTPFTLNLHSLNQHHWQYNGSVGTDRIGEQRGSIVATPSARSSGGFYLGPGEYDVFEVWNDVARAFDLDRDHVAITGYSMGGYGTYRIAGLYPDLFGAAATVVGPPANEVWVPGLPPTGGIGTLSNLWLENNRNLPYMNIAAGADELVPYAGPLQQNLGPRLGPLQSFDALDYRFRFVTFPAAEHLTLGLLSYDLPVLAEFLADATVEHDPMHVTYARVPATDDAALGLVHNQAYWLSNVELADPTGGDPVPKGVADVRSLAFGIGDPSSHRIMGLGLQPLPYVEVGRAWQPPPAAPIRNAMAVRLDNIGQLRIDLGRARLDPSTPIEFDVTSSHPAHLELVDAAGESRVVEVPPGTSHLVVSPARPS
jgi:dienelactone hydrolase